MISHNQRQIELLSVVAGIPATPTLSLSVGYLRVGGARRVRLNQRLQSSPLGVVAALRLLRLLQPRPLLLNHRRGIVGVRCVVAASLLAELLHSRIH